MYKIYTKIKVLFKKLILKKIFSDKYIKKLIDKIDNRVKKYSPNLELTNSNQILN